MNKLRVTRFIDSRLVLVFLFVIYTSLLVLQQEISYFPSDYLCRRIPDGAPFPFSMVREFVDRQANKRWVLLGDSILFGYGVSPKQSVGYKLAERGDFINLTNPGLAFPVQALLLQALLERYPEKRFIIELNPKWFVYSTFYERFDPLKAELSWPRRLLMDLALAELRYKIQYRWLNEGVTNWFPEFLQQGKGRYNERHVPPFIRQETEKGSMDIREAKEPFTDYFKESLQQVLSPDPERLIRLEDYQALLKLILRAKPNVGVVITPLDPEALRQMPALQQTHYRQLIELCAAPLKANHVPYRVLKLSPRDFVDYDHFSSSGHKTSLETIQELCSSI